MHHASNNRNKTEVLSIFTKTDIKFGKFMRGKKGLKAMIYLIIRKSLLQEDITMINIHIPDN